MHRDYSPSVSARRFRSIDSRIKLALAIGLVLLIVFAPIRFWPVFPVAGLATLMVYGLSGASWKFLISRLLKTAPILFLLGLSIPLSKGGHGWELGAFVFVRSFLSFAVMVTLQATTTFSAIVSGLSSLGCPRMIVLVMAFMVRFIDLFRNELDRMRVARRARMVRADWWSELCVTASCVASIFVRSLERSERVHAAMLARGWDGDPKRWDEPI